MGDPQPASFLASYRELLFTVNFRLWRPGTGQSCPRYIWLQKILRPVSALGDMTVSQATARQPSLITPFNSLLSVLDLAGEIVKQVLHYVRPGFGHLTSDNYCVNVAPCRMLARGKESVKCEKLSQPHRTGPQQEQTGHLDHCHQTRPVSGGTKMFVRQSNVPNVAHICL